MTLDEERRAWAHTYLSVTNEYQRAREKVYARPLRSYDDALDQGRQLAELSRRYEPQIDNAAHRIMTLEAAEERDGVLVLKPVLYDYEARTLIDQALARVTP